MPTPEKKDNLYFVSKLAEILEIRVNNSNKESILEKLNNLLREAENSNQLDDRSREANIRDINFAIKLTK